MKVLDKFTQDIIYPFLSLRAQLRSNLVHLWN